MGGGREGSRSTIRIALYVIWFLLVCFECITWSLYFFIMDCRNWFYIWYNNNRDWHPNTNHCGIFIALAKGFFNEQNVDVEIISAATIYDEKNKNNECDFPSTPAGYVLSGAADLAICPSETVISHYNYNNDSNEDNNRKSSLVAVATLLERDTSAIVTLKSSNISRPRELDNHAYGSYAARYEGIFSSKHSFDCHSFCQLLNNRGFNF